MTSTGGLGVDTRKLSSFMSTLEVPLFHPTENMDAFGKYRFTRKQNPNLFIESIVTHVNILGVHSQTKSDMYPRFISGRKGEH